MKVNKIRFDAIRAQWEILRMSAAYIHAEHRIAEQSAGNELDFNAATMANGINSEKFFHAEVDEFGNILRHVTEEEYLIAKGNEVQDKLNKALEEEEYRKAVMYKNILKGLEIKYNRLKGKQ